MSHFAHFPSANQDSWSLSWTWHLLLWVSSYFLECWYACMFHSTIYIAFFCLILSDNVVDYKNWYKFPSFLWLLEYHIIDFFIKYSLYPFGLGMWLSIAKKTLANIPKQRFREESHSGVCFSAFGILRPPCEQFWARIWETYNQSVSSLPGTWLHISESASAEIN